MRKQRLINSLVFLICVVVCLGSKRGFTLAYGEEYTYGRPPYETIFLGSNSPDGISKFWPIEMCAERVRDIQFVRGEESPALMVIRNEIHHFETPSHDWIVDLAMDNQDRLWLVTLKDKQLRVLCRVGRDQYEAFENLSFESEEPSSVSLILDGYETPWLSLYLSDERRMFQLTETGWVELGLPENAVLSVEILDPNTPTCLTTDDTMLKYVNNAWIEMSSFSNVPGELCGFYAIDGRLPLIVTKVRYGSEGSFWQYYYLDDWSNWEFLTLPYYERSWSINRDNSFAFQSWTHFFFDFRKFTLGRIPAFDHYDLYNTGTAIFDNRVAAVGVVDNDLFLYKSWPELSLETMLWRGGQYSTYNFKLVVQDTQLNRSGELQVVIGLNDSYWFYPAWTETPTSVPFISEEYKTEIPILDFQWLSPEGSLTFAAGVFDPNTGELVSPHAWNYTIVDF